MNVIDRTYDISFLEIQKDQSFHLIRLGETARLQENLRNRCLLSKTWGNEKMLYRKASWLYEQLHRGLPIIKFKLM